ncbi:NAD(+) synthase [Thermogymnomonas acidicola]|uniref:NAD(+) synthase n=1 Tax=Thermogymnomonas acidicola TaxID=399579 RepID=UPI000A736208|nr:NAD(+) synthase [Thermogymnomonas acidicola]
MVVLYYYANTDGGIVVGTTNRTEYLTGYYTKYGDGACDIEPIMHLYKHQVREMASYLGGVPRRIIEKKPTAGLWEGQTDEDELGITYDRLDRILEDLFDLRIGTLTEEHRRIRAMYEETKHKREMPRSLQ